MDFLLLPGLDGTGELFNAFVAAAPDGARCRIVRYPDDEVLDHRECAELVIDQALPDDPFVIVAESYSGPVGLLIAASRPANLRALVLSNSFAAPPVWTGWRHLPWRRLMSKPLPGWVAARYLVGNRDLDARLAELREVIERVDPGVMAARLREALTLDVRHVLERLEVPLLYLRGTGDRLVRNRSLDELAWCRPEIRTVHVVGPHLLLQVAPAACWKGIELFVAEVCHE